LIAELRVRLALGHGDEALPQLDAALQAAELAGRRRRALRLSFLRAQMLEGQGRPREASAACQIASKCDPLFAAKNDPFDGAETGGAEPHIAEQSRSWRAASGGRAVMRGS